MGRRFTIRIVMLAIFLLFMGLRSLGPSISSFGYRMGGIVGRELNRFILVYGPPGIPTPKTHAPVPTRTPTPTATVRRQLRPKSDEKPATTPTPESDSEPDGQPLSLRQYAEKIQSLMDDLGTTTEMLGELTAQVEADEHVLYDPTWVSDVDYYLDHLRSINVQIRNLAAPSALEEYQSELVKYADHSDEATNLFQRGIDLLDMDMVDESLAEYRLAFSAMDRANAILDKASTTEE